MIYDYRFSRTPSYVFIQYENIYEKKSFEAKDTIVSVDGLTRLSIATLMV